MPVGMYLFPHSLDPSAYASLGQRGSAANLLAELEAHHAATKTVNRAIAHSMPANISDKYTEVFGFGYRKDSGTTGVWFEPSHDSGTWVEVDQIFRHRRWWSLSSSGEPILAPVQSGEGHHMPAQFAFHEGHWMSRDISALKTGTAQTPTQAHAPASRALPDFKLAVVPTVWHYTAVSDTAEQKTISDVCTVHKKCGRYWMIEVLSNSKGAVGRLDYAHVPFAAPKGTIREQDRKAASHTFVRAQDITVSKELRAMSTTVKLVPRGDKAASVFDFASGFEYLAERGRTGQPWMINKLHIAHPDHANGHWLPLQD